MEVKEKHATHTPGPWQIDDCTPGESTGLRFEVGTKDSVIARTTDGWKEAHANARLIAAAPELLAQCKFLERMLVTTDHHSSNKLAKVREILAKVDGGEG